jgi:large subunit ribosomal protein L35
MKTHSGAKKRFKVTARGKVKHRSAGLNHINAKMGRNRKRKLGMPSYVDDTNHDNMRRLLLA